MLGINFVYACLCLNFPRLFSWKMIFLECLANVVRAANISYTTTTDAKQSYSNFISLKDDVILKLIKMFT